jgi:hypothetical protein
VEEGEDRAREAVKRAAYYKERYVHMFLGEFSGS